MSRARTLFIIAVMIGGCAQTVTPSQPLDASPYTACTGPGLGSADGTISGRECQGGTFCESAGEWEHFGPDRNGFCTARCTFRGAFRVPAPDCPQIAGFTAICDAIVGSHYPTRCFVLCGDGGVCPVGTSCIGIECRYPR